MFGTEVKASIRQNYLRKPWNKQNEVKPPWHYVFTYADAFTQVEIIYHYIINGRHIFSMESGYRLN